VRQKVVIAGEQTGFTVDQLIQLLNADIGMEAILDLIALRVRARNQGPLCTSLNRKRASAAWPT